MQRSGRRVVTDDLVGLYLRDESSPGRFGLTVSRKVGNAVVRNRVKRWLRESIRRQRHGLTGVDVVLIARRSAAAAGYASLSEQVGRVLTRVRGAA